MNYKSRAEVEKEFDAEFLDYPNENGDKLRVEEWNTNLTNFIHSQRIADIEAIEEMAMKFKYGGINMPMDDLLSELTKLKETI